MSAAKAHMAVLASSLALLLKSAAAIKTVTAIRDDRPSYLVPETQRFVLHVVGRKQLTHFHDFADDFVP
jgi:hypothetical protein